MPELADLVAWLREEAAKSRRAAELSVGLPSLGSSAEWAKDAAWHEAAARQLLEVERLRDALQTVSAPGWTVELIQAASQETLAALVAGTVAVAREALAPLAEAPSERDNR